MRPLLLSAILIAVLLLPGCASNERISLVSDQSQESLTRDGVPALLSSKKNIVVLRPASSLIKSGGRPAFIVAVYNRGKRPTDLLVREISVAGGGSGTEALHVYTYEELVAEAQRKQRWATFAAALGGAAAAMNAANAGYTRTTGTYSGYSHGRYSGGLAGSYSASTTGTFSATTYDAGRAYAAQQYASAQTAANFAAIRAQGEQALSHLQNDILKDNTVMPGEWVGGIVVLDPPSKSSDGLANYRIDVQFGGEYHSFIVNQAKA